MDFEQLLPDYLVFHQLGQGSSGSVFLGQSKKSKELVAIKVIFIHDTDDQVHAENTRKEANFLQGLDHPNVIKIFDVIETQNMMIIIMEYASKGTLTANIPLNPIDARYVFYQILCAVHYLHETKHIVHRDLKADNILLDDKFNVKVIDFGLSKKVESTSELMTTRCGSPCYVSPEVVLSNGYTSKAEVWSLGIILYLLFVGDFPFFDNNIQNLFRKILHEPVVFPDYVSIPQNIKNLIVDILNKDPKKRPTISEIMNNPWFRNKDSLKYQPLMTPKNSNISLGSTAGIPVSNSSNFKFNYLSITKNLEKNQTNPLNNIATKRKISLITSNFIFKKSPECGIQPMYSLKVPRRKSTSKITTPPPLIAH